MSTTFNLEIHTPYHKFFSAKVEQIILTIADGRIGVLAGHSPFTAPLEVCILKLLYTKKGEQKAEWRQAFLSDGIIEVTDSKTLIISDSAEWPEEINFERVELSKTEALKTLNDETFAFEDTAARKKLKRAEVRSSLKGVKNP